MEKERSSDCVIIPIAIETTLPLVRPNYFQKAVPNVLAKAKLSHLSFLEFSSLLSSNLPQVLQVGQLLVPLFDCFSQVKVFLTNHPTKQSLNDIFKV
jgi:hypothetical protein